MRGWEGLRELEVSEDFTAASVMKNTAVCSRRGVKILILADVHQVVHACIISSINAIIAINTKHKMTELQSVTNAVNAAGLELCTNVVNWLT